MNATCVAFAVLLAMVYADEFKLSAKCGFNTQLDFETKPKQMSCAQGGSKATWWDWKRVYTIVGCEFECRVIHDLFGNCIETALFDQRAKNFENCMRRISKLCQRKGHSLNLLLEKGRFKRQVRQLVCVGELVETCAKGQRVVLEKSTFREVPQSSDKAQPTPDIVQET